MKDDFSNFRFVYFIKNKNETKKCIKDFLNKAENITGNKVTFFRTDNGLEFINKDVKELFSDRGITHQRSVPYTPEQNGKAERDNRTLVEAARTMLHAKNLSKQLWAEAVHTAVFVLNRTGKSKTEGKSPFEVWTNKTFDINILKVFGIPVVTHIPKEKRVKWDNKGEKGLMVGYSEDVKGYRVYFPQKNTVEIKRDVVFIDNEVNNFEKPRELKISEDIVPLNEIDNSVDIPNIDETDIDKENQREDKQSENKQEEKVRNEIREHVEENQDTRPKRNVRQPVRFDDEFCYYCMTVNYCDAMTPVSFEEATTSSDAEKWKAAMDREMNSLVKNKMRKKKRNVKFKGVKVVN